MTLPTYDQVHDPDTGWIRTAQGELTLMINGVTVGTIDINGFHLTGIGIAASPVAVPNATTYTALAANSGRPHIIPDLTSSITITLPAPAAGLMFEFMGRGAAADAQNWIFSAGAGNFMAGGVVHEDTDAGSAGDEIVELYANGTTHITLTIVTPGAGTFIRFVSNGTLWFVNGRAVSAAIPTIAA